MPSWESQAAQYPQTGPPGISYFRGQVTASYFVDCLLYRDEHGELIGIANHYPSDLPPYEREGNVNVWVHPQRRRQGIGTELALECVRRWQPHEPQETRYTGAGLKWVTAMSKKYRDLELSWRTAGWQVWHDRISKDRPQRDS